MLLLPLRIGLGNLRTRFAQPKAQYLGTRIRITLSKTCSGDSSIESSIAVQAIAVRWGNDGVGLEFVLNDPRNLRRGHILLSDSGNREQLERFLERIKGDNDKYSGK